MTGRPLPGSVGAQGSKRKRCRTRIATSSDPDASTSSRTTSVPQPFSRADWIYAAAALTASLIVRIAVRLRIYGAEHVPPRGPALLVANHVSHLDPVVLSVVAHRLGRQVRLVAVQELFDKPALGSLARALGFIPVRLGNGAEVLSRAQAALAQGDLVLIYPEGTIPAAGVVVPARSGAALISVRAQVSVIPIASDGLERHGRRQSFLRRRVTVRIGCPINHAILAGVATDAGYKAASELLLQAVRSLSGTGARAGHVGEHCAALCEADAGDTPTATGCTVPDPAGKARYMTSLQHRLVVAYMQVSKRKNTTPESLHESIRSRREKDPPDPPCKLQRRMYIERCDEIGFPVYIVKSRKADSGRRIMYTHGGSYVNTIARQHWTFIATLAERLAATVIVPDYPLAPEHTWRDSFPKMVDLARRTADDAASDCTLIGDSSGGGFTLAVAQQLVAADMAPLPLVLIAPFVDLTLTNPLSRAIDGTDPWHSVEGLREAGRLWAGGDDPKRSEVSPLFGNFAGLGPLLVFSGTRDILNPQSHHLVEKARNDGVSVRFIEEVGLIHAYPLLPIPEARSAMERIIDFVVHK